MGMLIRRHRERAQKLAEMAEMEVSAPVAENEPAPAENPAGNEPAPVAENEPAPVEEHVQDEAPKKGRKKAE